MKLTIKEGMDGEKEFCETGISADVPCDESGALRRMQLQRQQHHRNFGRRGNEHPLTLTQGHIHSGEMLQKDDGILDIDSGHTVSGIVADKSVGLVKAFCGNLLHVGKVLQQEDGILDIDDSVLIHVSHLRKAFALSRSGEGQNIQGNNQYEKQEK